MRKLKKWIGELCFRVNRWKMKADDLDIGSGERSLREIWYTGCWVILTCGDTYEDFDWFWEDVQSNNLQGYWLS